MVMELEVILERELIEACVLEFREHFASSCDDLEKKLKQAPPPDNLH
jgi:hypothetical protein